MRTKTIVRFDRDGNIVKKKDGDPKDAGGFHNGK